MKHSGMLWHSPLPKSMEDVLGIDHRCKLACKTEGISAADRFRIGRSGVAGRFTHDLDFAVGATEVKVGNGAADVPEYVSGKDSHNKFRYDIT